MNKQLCIGVAIGIVAVYLIAIAIPTIDARDNPLIIQSGSGGGSAITSLTSTNSAITLNATTGNIEIDPKYKQLCVSIAGGGETTLTCTFDTTANRVIVFYVGIMDGAGTTTLWATRLNADSGNNYALRQSVNGGADATSINNNFLHSTNAATEPLYYQYTCNQILASMEKECFIDRVFSTSGAGNAPNRLTGVTKWSNTANLISSITLTRTSGTDTLSGGSFIMAWGLLN